MPVHSLDLALQGGGAHGAFTWGVLDALLQDERLQFGAVSGASAGAMNAAVLVSGLVSGGPEGARERLRSFWKDLNRTGREAGPLIPMIEAFPQTSRAMSSWWSTVFGDLGMAHASPELGREMQEILRKVIEDHVDFAAISKEEAPRIFVSATHAESGAVRIFRNEELTADALLASACLPLYFPPVTIEGKDYWDGGYSANPPLVPLVRESPNDDLLLITVNPQLRDHTPRNAAAIVDRITEIGFNQSMRKELQGLFLLKSSIGHYRAGEGLIAQVERLRLHEIHDEPTLAAMPAQTKLLPVRHLLLKLRDAGEAAAKRWCETSIKHLGKQSTVDLAGRFRFGLT
ncbi:patatin-like phospholipase family protein [Novosphingobium sp. ST904]|uniref:patatin-like phospholipase family protein n=1 Tax=Novosphingobium sp. ST904 TaxID=1684385 RepID=UPI0009EC2808|nr:patatin-like phospholipase family protein [Novosphingobium sp. ST904]TCM38073.1 NTE family protein [Novosphingobium sp. ST904]